MRKNPIYWNAALAVAGEGNGFSCNCIVEEVSGRAQSCFTSQDYHYRIPEVLAYKKAMGLRGNGAGHLPVRHLDITGWHDHRRIVRSIALLLAYESGVGNDLITAE